MSSHNIGDSVLEPFSVMPSMSSQHRTLQTLAGQEYRAQHIPDVISPRELYFHGGSCVSVLLRKKKKNCRKARTQRIGADLPQAKLLKFINTDALDTHAEEPASN